jgi:3-dehydroquinate dehydratase type I
VSVAERTLAAVREAVSGFPFAEIRLDALAAPGAPVRDLFSAPGTRIATCRSRGPDHSRKTGVLRDAVEAGAAFVDVELDLPEEFKKDLIGAARAADCLVIVSHHDFERTPPRAELQALTDRCFEAGADVAKLACAVNSLADCARLAGLLDDPRDIVVAGMGALGPRSRVMALLAGAPFVYASTSKDRETVPGQIDFATLAGIQEHLARAGI